MTEVVFVACQRYIELNPVRAGIVEAPADYPWSSYHTNALGVDDRLVSPHSLYVALGDYPERRQTAYRTLCADPLSDDLLVLIRTSANSGLTLGGIRLNASVGRNGVNESSDVEKVRELLNHNWHLLMPFDDLPVVGTVDDELIKRIETYQRRVLVNLIADGRVDPNGFTLAKLNENNKNLPQSIPLFPLYEPPTHNPETGGRQFGACRNRCGRKHAAVDLKAPPGTPIRAMEDGEVIVEPRIFYDSVKAFAIDHGSFIARYCEISRTAPGVEHRGVRVRKGQTIAYVGRLNSGNSMLHLELYSGTRTGRLTDKSRLPFQRRADLLKGTLQNSLLGRLFCKVPIKHCGE